MKLAENFDFEELLECLQVFPEKWGHYTTSKAGVAICHNAPKRRGSTSTDSAGRAGGGFCATNKQRHQSCSNTCSNLQKTDPVEPHSSSYFFRLVVKGMNRFTFGEKRGVAKPEFRK